MPLPVGGSWWRWGVPVGVVGSSPGWEWGGWEWMQAGWGFVAGWLQGREAGVHTTAAPRCSLEARSVCLRFPNQAGFRRRWSPTNRCLPQTCRSKLGRL